MDADDSIDVAPSESAGTKRDVSQRRKIWEHPEMSRACSASSESSDSCWLVGCLEKWNEALVNHLIVLTESSPGKICLTSGAAVAPIEFEQLYCPDEIAHVTGWLLRRHRCIETLQVGREDAPNTRSMLLQRSPEHVRAPSINSTSNVRHISGVCTTWKDLAPLLGAIGPIKKLESLSLRYTHWSHELGKMLANLLAANADSLRKIHLECVLYPCSKGNMGSDALIDKIKCCLKLEELVYKENVGTEGLEILAGFISSNQTLKKFWLAPERQVQIAFCDFMSENTTLTELQFKECNDEGTTNDVLKAVEKHDVLERLTIEGLSETSNARQLKSLISNNRSIRSLKILKATISPVFGKLIADGLSKNMTLECLDLSECSVFPESYPTFRKALTTKAGSVKFPSLDPPLLNSAMGRKYQGDQQHSAALKETRQTLAPKLRKKDLYVHVQVKWTDCHASGFAASLPFFSIDLEVDTAKLTPENFAPLCEALSSSLLVRSLTVLLSKDKTEYLEALSDALAKNASLKSVKLIDHSKSCGFAVKVAQGLQSNATVTYLKIVCRGMRREEAELLSDVIARNRSLNDIDLVLTDLDPVDRVCTDTLTQGVAKNPFITSFYITGACRIQIIAPVVRKSVFLNLAVRFVLRRDTGKLCNDAFKLFQAQPSLIVRVKEASGMSDEEAKAAVMSAARQIWSG